MLLRLTSSIMETVQTSVSLLVERVSLSSAANAVGVGGVYQGSSLAANRPMCNLAGRLP